MTVTTAKDKTYNIAWYGRASVNNSLGISIKNAIMMDVMLVFGDRSETEKLTFRTPNGTQPDIEEVIEDTWTIQNVMTESDGSVYVNLMKVSG